MSEGKLNSWTPRIGEANSALDEFINGVGVHALESPVSASSAPTPAEPELYLLKLKYITEHTPDSSSASACCCPPFDAKIAALTDSRRE